MHPNPQNQNRPETDEQPTPPNPQPDWRRWIGPVLLLFFILVLVFGPGQLNGVLDDSAREEISYTFLWENRDHIEAIVFEDNGIVATGTLELPLNEIANCANTDAEGVPCLTDEQRSQIEGQSELPIRFHVTLPPGAAEALTQYLLPLGGEEVVAGGEGTGESRATAPQVSRDEPQETSLLLSLLLNFVPLILIVAFFLWMTRRAQGQMNGVFGFGRSQAREYDAQTPRVTFDDVAGQEAAKRELVEIVDFLKEPEKYISLGARIPRGVLLVGPPGTGKTLMARAVAGEANVAFYSIAASEFVEMFVGVGASRVRDLFRKAKDNSPSIVFIDEIDAVGRQRGAGLGGGNDEREQTLNQMLAELEGFDQSSTVIVMAATNRPDVLDPALLRPGRFDRQVTVDLPDRAGRLSILKIHTRGKPLAKDIDLDAIAGATIGFSGADLSNLANEAALNAARKNQKRIEQGDFSYAFERIILGTERPPLSNAEERRVVAYHEAGHALTALLTPGADNVLKVTITPRGQALGVTAFLPEDDRRNYPRKYLEARIRVGLGGRAAEEITFDEVTTGAGGDIQMVTNIARRMVTQFGMSELGMIDYSNGGDQPFLGYSLGMGKQYSEETAARIDAEVRKIIDEA